MDFDASSADLNTELNFDPAQFGDPIDISEVTVPEPTQTILHCVAEQTIIQTIKQGTSCEDNEELNDSALRFVRHILSWSRAARCGFLPNFGNHEALRLVAREFIQSCGGGSHAIRQMMDSMQ